MQTIDKLVMVPIGKIKPYHKNPRRNDLTVERLVELIPRVGFNVPLVLDRKNTIVKGHTRWKAAVRLDMKELPCVYTDATPGQIRLDRIADNKVQEFSAWDMDALASELAGLNLSFDFDPGRLDFKIPAQVFTAPAQTGARQSEDDAAGFITQQDVARTVPQDDSTYDEVFCPKCGKAQLVRRG
jgi:hypothetical protein